MEKRTATRNEIFSYFSIPEVQKSKLKAHQALRQEAIKRLRKEQFWVKWRQIGEAFGRTGSSCQNLLLTDFGNDYRDFVTNNFDRIVIDKVMLTYELKRENNRRIGWFREVGKK